MQAAAKELMFWEEDSLPNGPYEGPGAKTGEAGKCPTFGRATATFSIWNELGLAISARDYANDMLDKGRAEIAALREALRFLVEETKWKSVDRDNMEFEGRVTYYQLDEARAALKGNGKWQLGSSTSLGLAKGRGRREQAKLDTYTWIAPGHVLALLDTIEELEEERARLAVKTIRAALKGNGEGKLRTIAALKERGIPKRINPRSLAPYIGDEGKRIKMPRKKQVFSCFLRGTQIRCWRGRGFLTSTFVREGRTPVALRGCSPPTTPNTCNHTSRQLRGPDPCGSGGIRVIKAKVAPPKSKPPPKAECASRHICRPLLRIMPREEMQDVVRRPQGFRAASRK